MSYQTNLTDAEWDLIGRYFHAFNYGNRSKHDKRLLVNAVLYLTKTGCQWRMLPHDFPKWQTVYSFFKRAKEDGTWNLAMRALVAQSRIKAGKSEDPTHGIIDSQSAKTTGPAHERGIDGGKKVKGRKRHIVTDTIGNLLTVKVHAANIHDTKAGRAVFQQAKFLYPSLTGVCADAGYRKTFEEFVLFVMQLTIDIKERIAGTSFKILAKRWIVERTFSWLNSSRRLSKDYEITTSSEEAFVKISHLFTLLRRISKS